MAPFEFHLDASNISQVVLLLGLAFGMVAVIASLVVHAHYLEARRKAQELEAQLQAKNKELQSVIQELKTTQVRLIESGKMSAAAALSAGILHQISQPVTAIHGFVRFLKQEMPKDHLFYRPVSLMDEQSVYLKEMLDNLMTLIRHRKIAKAKVGINAVMERSVSLVTDELRIRRINWETALDPSAPIVLADAIHLQQVFMNIMINACEALATLPRGQERKLHISTKFDSIQRNVEIAIKDNGPGIPKEALARIFEPLFSTKTSGSGIGLALCYDLVREHGGTIAVDSTAGETVFKVRLPVSS
jgi:two-component system, NtrC family, sensor kinase